MRESFDMAMRTDGMLYATLSIPLPTMTELSLDDYRQKMILELQTLMDGNVHKLENGDIPSCGVCMCTFGYDLRISFLQQMHRRLHSSPMP